MQTTPDPGALANRHLRLALTSLLLSLVPLAAWGLYLLLPTPVLGVLPQPPGPLFYGLSAVLYAGVFIGSVVAVVTGVRVLGRDQQPPLQRVVGIAAGAGVVIGIVDILFLAPWLFFVLDNLLHQVGGIG
jgi:hypothetical protein